MSARDDYPMIEPVGSRRDALDEIDSLRKERTSLMGRVESGNAKILELRKRIDRLLNEVESVGQDRAVLSDMVTRLTEEKKQDIATIHHWKRCAENAEAESQRCNRELHDADTLNGQLLETNRRLASRAALAEADADRLAGVLDDVAPWCVDTLALHAEALAMRISGEL